MEGHRSTAAGHDAQLPNLHGPVSPRARSPWGVDGRFPDPLPPGRAPERDEADDEAREAEGHRDGYPGRHGGTLSRGPGALEGRQLASFEHDMSPAIDVDARLRKAAHELSARRFFLGRLELHH